MWLVVLFALAAVFVYFQEADLLLMLLPYSNIEKTRPFKDRVVWIVGASSGIGASLTGDMIQGGAKVIISARRANKLQEVATECRETYGIEPYLLPLDMLDPKGQANAVKNVIKLFGRIDILVLNAGQTQRNSAITTSLQDTRDLMELNFLSQISLTKLVLPIMMENDVMAGSSRSKGQVVVTSSLSGLIGTPVAASYSATKFALHGYFNALRAEVQELNNIAVTIVCPGPVHSEIGSAAKVQPGKKGSDDEGRKMETKRCSELMARGIYYELQEIWIANNPFILFAYLQQYFPGLSRQVHTKIAGPGRIKALDSNNGKELFDVAGMIKSYLTGQ